MKKKEDVSKLDHESKMKNGTSGILYAGAKIDKLWRSNFSCNRNK